MTGVLPPDVTIPFVHDLVPLVMSALDPSAHSEFIVKQAAWLIANLAALDDSAAAQEFSQSFLNDQVLPAACTFFFAFPVLL